MGHFLSAFLSVGGIEIEVHRLIEPERLELSERDMLKPISFHDITTLDDRMLLIQS